LANCGRLDKCAKKKFGINGQLGNKLYLIVSYRFSLVKALLNAPLFCKLLNGVKKRLIQLPKIEQRLLRTCQLRSGQVFEA
jgi:hypothetical protein